MVPLGIGLLLTAAVSRADADAAIAHCAASGSKDQRIACLERALRALAGEQAVSAAVAGDAGRSRDAQVQRAPAPRVEPALPQPEPGSPATTPAVSAAGQMQDPGANPAAADLGAEQVQRKGPTADRDDAVVSATAVDFRFVGYHRLLVQLDNGQIWRQIDGDRASVERRLRDEESFEVEMWATRLGGYRMKILPLDRTIRVERLQ